MQNSASAFQDKYKIKYKKYNALGRTVRTSVMLMISYVRIEEHKESCMLLNCQSPRSNRNWVTCYHSIDDSGVTQTLPIKGCCLGSLSGMQGLDRTEQAQISPTFAFITETAGPN
ncbi:Protein bicaudal D like protein 1 [Platysternon megacephalum]|uniref:Protein bicaudal D like protein 1 n=1 Tax=Platysternon megacephalum TaxID=55544 RepID=A0A4D9E1L7_9SAUR|nr:Protein bicaudal D like protein 1 [Platysternon megacephalum]